MPGIARASDRRFWFVAGLAVVAAVAVLTVAFAGWEEGSSERSSDGWTTRYRQYSFSWWEPDASYGFWSEDSTTSTFLALSAGVLAAAGLFVVLAGRTDDDDTTGRRLKGGLIAAVAGGVMVAGTYLYFTSEISGSYEDESAILSDYWPEAGPFVGVIAAVIVAIAILRLRKSIATAPQRGPGGPPPAADPGGPPPPEPPPAE
jgi:hypothetical protein